MKKFYSVGTQSSKEGMTFVTSVFDENNNFITGYANPEKTLFKCREITQEEYDGYMRMLDDPSVPKGLAGGILNSNGLEDLKKFSAEKYQHAWEKKLKQNESKIDLTVRKIKKQLELGIITSEDVDVEIELNNMKDFTNTIKKRLNQ